MIPFYSDKEDKDFRDVAGAMASAFNTLRFEPDKGLDTALQTIKQQRSARRAKNKTVEYLRGLGQPEATRLANMVETGQLTGQQAYSQIFALEQEKRAADRAAANAARSLEAQKAAADLAFERQKELYAYKAGIDALTPQKRTEFQRRFDIFKAANPNMSDADILKLMDGPQKPPQVGSIPQGYELVQSTNEAGETVLRMVPIKGGPEDTTKSDEAARTADLKTAGIITGAIDSIQEKLKTTKLPIAGFAGSKLSQIAGTNAYDVRALVDTIRANIGFQALQDMREASPTGGALGQVSNQEIGFLQATLKNLDQGQTVAQFEQQLTELENIYTQIITKLNAYPEEAKKLAGYTDVQIGGSSPKRMKFDKDGNLIDG